MTAQAVGDYDVRGQDYETVLVGAVNEARGCVYVGGFEPAAGVLFIKGGKSDNPRRRSKQYGTMLPGGLSFMWAAPVSNASQAERALLTAIAAIDGVERVGGEWFKCDSIMRLTVLDALAELGPMRRVDTFCPAAFDRPKKKLKKNRSRA